MAVNMLLSFAYYGKEDLTRYRMTCGRLMIDSGAFTAYTLGKPVSLEAYAEYLSTFHGVWDHAVTLDVIGDPVATRKNTQKLHARGLNVMPVFTRGGTVADFDAMVKDSGYVCVGGGVGMPLPVAIKRLRGLQRRAEDLGGGIHALGVGRPDALRQIRPYSSDSSTAAAGFRFGNVMVYDGRSLSTFPKDDRVRVKRHLSTLRSQGLDTSELVRTGRMPTGAARGPLMRGMAVATSCADEDLTRMGVPVPTGVTDTPGTHLYVAVVGGFLAPAVTELDRSVHDGSWTASMWERYRPKHESQCRTGDRVSA